jgi:putative NIF3 family GTP cyclohydrolase 1 type 2
MYKVKEIARFFEKIAPLDSGIPGDELGFIYGDPDTEVTGLACLWNVHTKSIQSCVEKNTNMIICHESIWLPGQDSHWYEGPGKEDIFSNRERKKWLDKHGIVVYRSHSNWDALEGDGVADQAILALGIEGLQVVARQKFFSVQQLPHEMSVKTLCLNVENGLGFQNCRIFGDKEKRVRNFAFLIGGFGENQVHMPQAARDLGAEVIIIGEMSEFIVVACLEMGLPVIESLHSISEIPAIKRQAVILSKHFPDLPVYYIPSGAMSFIE